MASWDLDDVGSLPNMMYATPYGIGFSDQRSLLLLRVCGFLYSYARRSPFSRRGGGGLVFEQQTAVASSYQVIDTHLSLTRLTTGRPTRLDQHHYELLGKMLRTFVAKGVPKIRVPFWYS